MNTTIRIADERDWDAIAQLNHDTYAVELGQYEPQENGRKTDRLHKTNVYVVVYVQDELAGMVSITLPSKAPFSTLNRLPFIPVDIQYNLHKTAEIRLLAIKPSHRGIGLYSKLILFVMRFIYAQGIDRVLISGIANRVSLYEFMGFHALAEPVTEGTATYVPMLLTKTQFEASPFRAKLAPLETAVRPSMALAV